MEKDAAICKERYEFLRMCHGGKGPVPWTRDEDKQIFALVSEHGKLASFKQGYETSRFFPSICPLIIIFALLYRSQEVEFHSCQSRREEWEAVP
jgi:hypothetical protein